LNSNKCLQITDTTIVCLLNKDPIWYLWNKFLDMQMSSHSYHCECLYICLMCTLCYNMYICCIILSGFIDVWSNNIEMYSIEHYITAIGLFNPRKWCLYGLVNCWVDSYQQIMLTNFLCSVLALSFFYRVRFRKLI
jgi:hypothetical protein